MLMTSEESMASRQLLHLYENVPESSATEPTPLHRVGGLAGEDVPVVPPGEAVDGRWLCVWTRKSSGVETLRRPIFRCPTTPPRVRCRKCSKRVRSRNGSFEWDGMRRDTAPGRQARQDVANTIAGGARNRGGYSTDDIPMTPDVAQCLTTGTGQRYDPETETILPVAHAARRRLRRQRRRHRRGTPLVPVAFAENSRSEIRLEGGDGQRTGALRTGAGSPDKGCR